MHRPFRVLALASAVLLAATAARAQPFLLDHFNVYRSSGPPPPVSGVNLVDQFGAGVTALGPSSLFMVPAVKNGEDIQDRIGHLTCYEVADPGADGPPVIATNQFGTSELTLGQAKHLCVPTVKVITPGTTGLDHYKCYAAIGAQLDVQVGLQDQFQQQLATVLDPFLFCNPVAKNGEPIANRNDHLACYLYSPPGELPGTVAIMNQFIPDTLGLAVGPSIALCVPTEKRPIGPEPVDHFAMYTASGPDGPPVSITDQFGSEDTDLGNVNLFMVPANKNGEGIMDSISHLACHEIVDGSPAPSQVIVGNQFGPQVLDLGLPRELCVPTEKLLTPGVVTIDHFKCYEAFGQPVDVNVDWADQFQGVGVLVRDPFLLCNPADKNGEGISNPVDHLVCYRADPPAPLGLQTDVVNQFNAGGPIDILDAFALCVPSSKTLPPKTPSLSSSGALGLGGALALAALLSLGLWRRRSRA